MRRFLVFVIAGILGFMPTVKLLAAELRVAVNEPGTLLSVIESKADFDDVTILIVEGVLNDDDNIWPIMPNLVELDLSKCNLNTFRGLSMMNEIRKVVLPASTKELDMMAVYLCPKLEEFIMPRIENLGMGNFMYCPSLKEIHIPGTVTSGSIYFGGTVYHESINPTRRVVGLAYDEDYNVMPLRHLVPEMAIEKYREIYSEEDETVVASNHQISSVTITTDYVLNDISDLQGTYVDLAGYNYLFDSNQTGSLTVDAGSTPWNISGLDMLVDYHSDDYQYKDGDYFSVYKEMSQLLVKDTPVRANDITLQMGESGSTKNWTFFSLPFDTRMSDVEAGATDWVVCRFDGEKRTRQGERPWVKVGQDETLNAHEGYILTRWHEDYNDNDDDYDYGYDDDDYDYDDDNDGITEDFSPFVFHAAPTSHKQDIFTTNDALIPLQLHPSSNIFSSNWNYVANPYPCSLRLSGIEETVNITVRTEYEGYVTFNTLDDGSVMLPPLMPFFVQSNPIVQELHISKDARSADACRVIEKMYDEEEDAKHNRAPSMANRQVFNITLTDGNIIDRTRFVINPKATMGYEINRDALKFMSDREDVPQIYIIDANQRLAIDERPESCGIIDIGVQTASDEMHTLHIDAKDASMPVVLIDKLTGVRTNFLTDDYTFTSVPGILDNRFALAFGEAATGIVDIQQNSNNSVESFDLLGRRVRENSNARIIIKGNKKVIK